MNTIYAANRAEGTHWNVHVESHQSIKEQYCSGVGATQKDACQMPQDCHNMLLEARTNVIKSQALKNIVPLITHMYAWAERAAKRHLCYAQPPAHLNGRAVKQAENKSSVTSICHSRAMGKIDLTLDVCAYSNDDVCTTWHL